jgi:transcriptional regulator with XRE-family HTH domain
VRNDRGLTQAAVAKALGVHPITVTRWESGKLTPSAELLVSLAQLYGMTVDALLGMKIEGHAPTVVISGTASTGNAAQTMTGRLTRLPHSVLVYLDEFRLRLRKAGASDEDIEESLELLRSTDVLNYLSGPSGSSDPSEEELLDGMRSLGEHVIIPRLKRAGRLMGARSPRVAGDVLSRLQPAERRPASELLEQKPAAKKRGKGKRAS